LNLIVEVKLKPTKEQVGLLKATQRRFNEACNFVSSVAFENKEFNRYKLHHLTYYDVRGKFKLPSMLAELTIAKVANSYKVGKKSTLRRFRPTGSILFNPSLLTFREDDMISIRLLDGREKMFFDMGEYQRNRWEFPKGQSTLVLRQGKYFLQISTKIPEEPMIETEEFLGVDLGIVNLATDSDGEIFSGQKVEQVRRKHITLRKALQACGTKSAKRHLKKVSRRESNFRKNTNHIISKLLVEKAKRTCRGIALEELKGIRQSKAPSKLLRAQLGSWAFAQMRLFLEYKSTLAGIPVVFVDPAYTSQTCSMCGFVDKANRKSQSDFSCLSCHHTENADVNAAKNIARIAAVNQQIVGTEATKAVLDDNRVAA